MMGRVGKFVMLNMHGLGGCFKDESPVWGLSSRKNELSLSCDVYQRVPGLQGNLGVCFVHVKAGVSTRV